MKIGIPCAEGELCMHFGHCQQFALVDVDEEKRTIGEIAMLTPPPHEPGLLPRWLAEKGATMVIAGGMGMRAQQIFASQGIEVLTGASAAAPSAVVQDYLDGTLQTGANACDH
jgi:predicted Fe-Mo cluster-binding NifX family protein